MYSLQAVTQRLLKATTWGQWKDQVAVQELSEVTRVQRILKSDTFSVGPAEEVVDGVLHLSFCWSEVLSRGYLQTTLGSTTILKKAFLKWFVQICTDLTPCVLSMYIKLRMHHPRAVAAALAQVEPFFCFFLVVYLSFFSSVLLWLQQQNSIRATHEQKKYLFWLHTSRKKVENNVNKKSQNTISKIKFAYNYRETVKLQCWINIRIKSTYSWFAHNVTSALVLRCWEVWWDCGHFIGRCLGRNVVYLKKKKEKKSQNDNFVLCHGLHQQSYKPDISLYRFP